MIEVINNLQQRQYTPFIKGLLLTLLISVIAGIIVHLPILSIFGQLVLAIVLGICWRAVLGVPDQLMEGVNFASQKMLRIGIILLGIKLNLIDIYHAGMNVFLIAVINVTFTLIFVFILAKLFKVKKDLAILTACGTAICGAAAVIAISSQLKANENDTAIAAATVCLLGTVFTLFYTMTYSLIDLSPVEFGLFSGGTLHEVAHVIAAATPAGSNAVDMAVIAKLTRVALLIPVAFIVGLFAKKQTKKDEKSSFPVPWFILVFLIMSFINTVGFIPQSITTCFVFIANVFMGMAMAGLGMKVELSVLKQKGKAPFLASSIGSILLVFLGYFLLRVLST